jgi:hypothetical protein
MLVCSTWLPTKDVLAMLLLLRMFANPFSNNGGRFIFSLYGCIIVTKVCITFSSKGNCCFAYDASVLNCVILARDEFQSAGEYGGQKQLH